MKINLIFILPFLLWKALIENPNWNLSYLSNIILQKSVINNYIYGKKCYNHKRTVKGSGKMLNSSLAYVILRVIPESTILMLSSFILLDLKLDKLKVLKYGFFSGIIVTLIRTLPINFGVHSLLSMIALGLILFKVSGKNFMEVVIAPCNIWIALALSEGIYYFIAKKIININPEILTNYQTISGAVSTLPSLAILVMIIMIIKSMKKRMMKSF